ncbi:hypothetical protein [Candidatus Binatus sp.]|uniref:hypothetical protein n=1 Tax=Candidatus Binatus sp. TaxID=2811406 RepID=UPI003C6ECC1C
MIPRPQIILKKGEKLFNTEVRSTIVRAQIWTPTIVVHGTAMLTLADPIMRAVNVSMFLKGLAMIACALFITQFGVSPASTR